MTASAGLGGAFVRRRRKGAGGRRVPGKMGRPGPLRGEAKLGRRPGREKKKKKGMGCAGRSEIGAFHNFRGNLKEFHI